MRNQTFEKDDLRFLLWDAVALLIRTIDQYEQMPNRRKLPSNTPGLVFLQEVVSLCRKFDAPYSRKIRNRLRARAVSELAELYRRISRNEISVESFVEGLNLRYGEPKYLRELSKRANVLALDKQQIRVLRGPVEAACIQLGKIWGLSPRQVFNIRMKFLQSESRKLTLRDYELKELELDQRILKKIFQKLFYTGWRNHDRKVSSTALELIVSHRLKELQRNSAGRKVQTPLKESYDFIRYAIMDREMQKDRKKKPAVINSPALSPIPQTLASALP